MTTTTPAAHPRIDARALTSMPPARARCYAAYAMEHPEDWVRPKDIRPAAGVTALAHTAAAHAMIDAGHLQADPDALWPLTARLTATGRAYAGMLAARALLGYRRGPSR
jgi:hypothetical protein